MKAAFLAYDKNSLAHLPVLSNYFEQIDFYLVDTERATFQVNFNEVPLLIDTFSIPWEDSLQTLAHQKVLHSIRKELLFYKTELIGDFKKTTSNSTGVQKNALGKVMPISAIKDIVYNSKLGDVYIEKDKVGISEYKFLFVENHQVVSENFNRFSKNIFQTPPQNTHVWFSVEFDFELKKPRHQYLGDKKFILVQDRMNQAVLDNWYFVRTAENKITVQQWVPFNQFKNSDFQKFIIDRAEKVLKEKFSLIQISKLNQFYVNATPGFSFKKTALKNTKLTSLMPSVNFWSQELINRFLYFNLDTKMRELNKPKATNSLPRG